MANRDSSSALLLLILIATLVTACSPAQSGENKQAERPQNIILLIGDGMGLAQVSAGIVSSDEPLAFEEFNDIGLQKTSSLDKYVTDSGASGTALATGEKTNNGHIAMSPKGDTLTTILELAEQNGLATGLVSTSSILHATPASFIAHNKDRHAYEELALDFLDTDVDVFIGGGLNSFSKREDGRDLTEELREKGYSVLTNLDEITEASSAPLAGFTAEEHNPSIPDGRGEMLPRSTETALSLLSQNEKGFFLMVESSQIDWGGHDNDQDYIISETLDFNKTIEAALKFAETHPNTLVIVTADHETGGMGLNGGNLDKHTVESGFTTGGHTGIMVPVFAKGPGSEQFRGIYENTAIFEKMKMLYGF